MSERIIKLNNSVLFLFYTASKPFVLEPLSSDQKEQHVLNLNHVESEGTALK